MFSHFRRKNCVLFAKCWCNATIKEKKTRCSKKLLNIKKKFDIILCLFFSYFFVWVNGYMVSNVIIFWHKNYLNKEQKYHFIHQHVKINDVKFLFYCNGIPNRYMYLFFHSKIFPVQNMDGYLFSLYIRAFTMVNLNRPLNQKRHDIFDDEFSY